MAEENNLKNPKKSPSKKVNKTTSKANFDDIYDTINVDDVNIPEKIEAKKENKKISSSLEEKPSTSVKKKPNINIKDSGHMIAGI